MPVSRLFARERNVVRTISEGILSPWSNCNHPRSTLDLDSQLILLDSPAYLCQMCRNSRIFTSGCVKSHLQHKKISEHKNLSVTKPVIGEHMVELRCLWRIRQQLRMRDFFQG